MWRRARAATRARASPHPDNFLSVKIEYVSSLHMQVENHAVHSFASMH